MSWPCLSVCLALVCSIAFAVVICPWESRDWLCLVVFWVSSCVVVQCACSVYVTLLAWRLLVQFLQFTGSRCSLPIPPPKLFFLPLSYLAQVWRVPEEGLGAGDLWLGCGLGRPVGCSSALGLWLRLQPQGFLGTYPPLATWVLMLIINEHANGCYFF